MTNAMQVVLDSVPGPESDGVALSVITKSCNRQGINELDCWSILGVLVDEGLIERFEDCRDRGTRNYYRQTEKAVAA